MPDFPLAGLTAEVLVRTLRSSIVAFDWPIDKEGLRAYDDISLLLKKKQVNMSEAAA